MTGVQSSGHVSEKPRGGHGLRLGSRLELGTQQKWAIPCDIPRKYNSRLPVKSRRARGRPQGVNGVPPHLTSPNLWLDNFLITVGEVFLLHPALSCMPRLIAFIVTPKVAGSCLTNGTVNPVPVAASQGLGVGIGCQ